MPDVSKTDIGRRMFQLQKEKSVENIIERIRKRLGDEWKLLTQDDIKILTLMLGDAWVYVERDLWESWSFTKLTLNDVLDIIRLGNQVQHQEKTVNSAVEDVVKILKLRQ